MPMIRSETVENPLINSYKRMDILWANTGVMVCMVLIKHWIGYTVL